jgi:aspartate carbamoyltransferase catalytic subunit
MTSPRDNCINQAAFSIAMSTQDEKFCDKILSEEQKKMCKTSLENQKEMAKKSVPVPIGQPAPAAKETPIKKK